MNILYMLNALFAMFFIARAKHLRGFDEADNEGKWVIRRREGLVVSNNKRATASEISSAETVTTAASTSAAGESSTDASTTTLESTAAASTGTLSTTISTADASSTGVSSTITSSTGSSATVSSTDVSSTGATETSTTSSATGSIMSGTNCFTTTKTSTSACDVETNDGHVTTATCTPTEVLTSTCAPSLICTTNSVGDICMEAQGIETGGVIVAIVFAVVAVAGFGGICFASSRDSRNQKRLEEKAEALAENRRLLNKRRATNV
ncbi:hypothetical protein QQX98_000952 [Neonectria punicea]|uniref:Extracellular membrane protein CFEM domain-containing protein n=1 Tax=Neonectria punicea TaxID=979145 RepID=A0ABR1HQI8_9HYPO